MKYNNLHRNVFCITSLSLRKTLLIFFLHETSFSLNTLWYNQLYHAPMFARKKGSVSRHSTFNIISKIRIWVCIPFCESQWVECVWTLNRFLVSLCTLQGYYHHGQTGQNETWAESNGAQRCAWLPENWSYSVLFFRTNGGIFTSTVKYQVFLCLEAGVTLCLIRHGIT